MKTADDKRFVCEFGKFVLDPQEKTLFLDDRAMVLPVKEFETLLLLVENNGKALSKEEMMQGIWPGAFVEETNLAKQISCLRKILNTVGENLSKLSRKAVAAFRLKCAGSPLALLKYFLKNILFSL
jgi:DNA-binding winged helix-turn-helix (wHTH) protein